MVGYFFVDFLNLFISRINLKYNIFIQRSFCQNSSPIISYIRKNLKTP